jgi:hypothetical protein
MVFRCLRVSTFFCCYFHRIFAHFVLAMSHYFFLFHFPLDSGSKVDDMSLFEYFSACGEVTDVKLVLDQRTGKSKGLAYIEARWVCPYESFNW